MIKTPAPPAIGACSPYAAEVCPLFPGNTVRVHWSIADPSAVVGGEATRLRAFAAVADELTERIRGLIALAQRHDEG